MEERQTLSLSELTSALDGFFKKRFGGRAFWVVAEISSHQFYSKSQRHYLNLIEKHEGRDQIVAQMGAVIWSNVHPKVKAFEQATGQQFANGLEVLFQAEVSYHQLYGMKLNIIDVDASFTLGKLEKQRLETLRRLTTEHPNIVRKVGEGFRTFNQDRVLPQVIQKVALITSEKAAGYDDFYHTLRSNEFGYTFEIDQYFAPVQGLSSWPKITSRVREVSSKHGEYDVVVMVRGGGSQTDLVLFDQYDLALEIARCNVPVLTGIGHHRDESIADMFCHTRLKTPTKVAEFLIAHNRDFEANAVGLMDRVEDFTVALLKTKRQRLDKQSLMITGFLPDRLRKLDALQNQLMRRLISGSEKNRSNAFLLLSRWKSRLENASGRSIEDQERELNLLSDGLDEKVKTKLQQQNEKLKFLERMVNVSDPKQVLKKGYAI
ncbi:MAG: exodeoxyribonuclease VII large subunit, partial [Flavobacteriales bacterium]|nr:exodeoxyribonuclease VII large subunit [Flavobacteriales bacterium]